MKPIGDCNIKFRYDYDFLVCFKPKEKCGSWIGRTFGHVVLFRNVTGTTSVKIEPTLGGVLIIPYACNVKEIWSSLEEDFKTYVFQVKHEDFKHVNVIMLGTCVSIVKNLLGIRAWWIITPKQLEKYIRREYGRHS